MCLFSYEKCTCKSCECISFDCELVFEAIRTLFLGQRDIEMLGGEAGMKRALDSLMPKNKMTTTEVDWELTNHPAAAASTDFSTSPIRYIECNMHLQPGDGITITDLNRKLFFRRHLPQNTLIYAGVDPRKKEFVHPEHKLLGISKPRIYGIIARSNSGDNTCHLFCDLDPSMTAKNVTAFVSSYMISRV
ncbi:Tensin 1 [Cichlidogyrus casuarinus]|uniref:Tensin 1 n=1 Tax=Cichlidogyrus casuarinus TaxID=1844966 RepID=A0ABD2PKC6_9PLAT